jgi:hypothetical protein
VSTDAKPLTDEELAALKLRRKTFWEWNGGDIDRMLATVDGRAARIRELETALEDVEEWVSGVAQDHVPNEVFHRSGGFDIMERARAALRGDQEDRNG